jgi:hypothetical protein
MVGKHMTNVANAAGFRRKNATAAMAVTAMGQSSTSAAFVTEMVNAWGVMALPTAAKVWTDAVSATA